MKKLLLTLAASFVLGSLMPADAYNKSYIFLDDDGNYVFGILRRVSPNGRWVCGGDEVMELGSLLIDTEVPDQYTYDTNGMMLDVDDNGLVVGAYYEKLGGANYKRAAIYHDGEWEQLPLPEAILGQSYAVAISADSRTIAGHGMCANDAPDEPGKYFPMVWKYNDETGKYDLAKLYNSLYLPGTYGFFIQDMTPDATVVCGLQCLDMGDFIAAMLNIETGEYKIWHDIEYREYQFTTHGHTFYTDGMFVDGILDGFDSSMCFDGRFNYATDRYLFGQRSIAYNVQDDGTGEISTLATVYDLETGEFVDIDSGFGISCGVSPQEVFTTAGTVINHDRSELITDLVDTEDVVDYVYDLDEGRRVMAASHVATTMWGEPYESPILVIFDEPVFAGIDQISVDGSAAIIQVNGNTVSVDGAEAVAIYNTNGQVVSRSHTATLSNGLYIIVADGVSHKALVK